MLGKGRGSTIINHTVQCKQKHNTNMVHTLFFRRFFLARFSVAARSAIKASSGSISSLLAMVAEWAEQLASVLSQRW